MTPPIDIRADHLRLVQDVLHRHLPDGVTVWVFGSRATWMTKDSSDLDLALEGDTAIPPRSLSTLEVAFEDSDLPFAVDIVDVRRINERFRRIVAQQRVRLPESDGSRPTDGSSGRLEICPDWREIPFTEAFLVNPPTQVDRGSSHPFVDMAAVDPSFRSVRASEVREFRGGGSRFRDGDTLVTVRSSRYPAFGSRTSIVEQRADPVRVPSARRGHRPVLAVDNASVRLARPHVHTGTTERLHTLMARITPCLENGKVARYCADGAPEPAHGSTEFIVVRGCPGTTDTEFAYYVTRSTFVRDYAIGQMTGTSGRQRVPTESLEHLTIAVPSLPEQRAIAHILGTLDDKIELNRRMNATLEAMARALFRSWFVDFDPVRAKMEGRDPGLPKEIADLFPDRLVDSELGRVPEGWNDGHVEDGFEIIMGQSPPGHTYNDIGDGLPFFQGRSDFGFRYPSNRKFCAAPNRMAEPWDTIVSVRAPVGDINMAWERCCIGRGVAALRHKSGAASFGYYTAQALQVHMREYEHTGTVFGAINRKQLAVLPLVQPAADVVRAFERLVHPWDQTMRLRTAQGDTVTALRDTLLPKLVSGELRVNVREQTHRAGGPAIATAGASA